MRKQRQEIWDFGGLQVLVTFKSARSMRLRIREKDGQPCATVPFSVSKARARRFIQDNLEWVRKAKLDFDQSSRGTAASATPQEQARWKAQLQETAPVLIAKWESALGVKAGKIAYRNMTSKWGSCQPSTGRICLNTRLALYPPECLEYVVVHELCHLLEANHSPRFWALVESALPDWRQCKARLGQ